MRLIAKRAVREFWEQYPEAMVPLQAWCKEVKRAAWSKAAEVKAKYGSASIVSSDRVVFNICGNKFRLIAKINYRWGLVYVRFIGTHREYDQVDAEAV
ncbi:MAG: type II toxin-antitoxin system HigB family toxin [Planctomycetota bacterium]